MSKIVVIGSSNIDLVANVGHLPKEGETIGDAIFSQNPGGKGANQAIAASRLGGSVTFVTSLGNDIYAEKLKENYKKEGFITDYIIYDEKNPTGIALIFVAKNGANCIAVAPGANYHLSSCSSDYITEIVQNADIVMLQAEIPYNTIKQSALIAKEKNAKVLFNPAPACKIDEELMKAIDILVVNETEAEYISGIPSTGNNIHLIADELLEKGAKNVVITLGSEGVYLKNDTKEIKIPSYKVHAIDTIAAGDTFCGALAVACANSDIDDDALEFANAAAAISVTRKGAQPSIPTIKEVRAFMEKMRKEIVINL